MFLWQLKFKLALGEAIWERQRTLAHFEIVVTTCYESFQVCSDYPNSNDPRNNKFYYEQTKSSSFAFGQFLPFAEIGRTNSLHH